MEFCYFFWNSKVFLFSVKKAIYSQGTKLFWLELEMLPISIILEVTDIKPVRVDRLQLQLGLGIQSLSKRVGKFWKMYPNYLPQSPFFVISKLDANWQKMRMSCYFGLCHFNVFHFSTSQRIYSEYFQWNPMLVPSQHDQIITRKLGFCTILQDLTSLTRDQTRGPSNESLSPNHWTTRECPINIF